jgi:hypothetical protein
LTPQRSGRGRAWPTTIVMGSRCSVSASENWRSCGRVGRQNQGKKYFNNQGVKNIFYSFSSDFSTVY